MFIGNKHIPEELFDRYLWLIKATEQGGGMYSYEFDERRQQVHDQILECTGLIDKTHTKDYRDFQALLDKRIEDLLTSDKVPTEQAPTKVNKPVSGF